MDQPTVASVTLVPGYPAPVVQIQGYFEESLGEKLNALHHELLLQGNTCFILDFSRCSVVNSLGLAVLIDVKDRILGDYKGRLIFVALKPTMKKAFEFAELIPGAIPVENLAQALTLV
jgi:anti-anti-sigma regulatory factor